MPRASSPRTGLRTLPPRNQPDVTGAQQTGTWARVVKTWAPLLPFAGWMLLFLGIPAIAVASAPSRNRAASGFTMANVNTATTGVYLLGFKNSLKMASIDVDSARDRRDIPGLCHPYLHGDLVLRRLVVTASGVFANFGGIPWPSCSSPVSAPRHALVNNWLADVAIHFGPASTSTPSPGWRWCTCTSRCP